MAQGSVWGVSTPRLAAANCLPPGTGYCLFPADVVLTAQGAVVKPEGHPTPRSTRGLVGGGLKTDELFHVP